MPAWKYPVLAASLLAVSLGVSSPAQDPVAPTTNTVTRSQTGIAVLQKAITAMGGDLSVPPPAYTASEAVTSEADSSVSSSFTISKRSRTYFRVENTASTKTRQPLIFANKHGVFQMKPDGTKARIHGGDAELIYLMYPPGYLQEILSDSWVSISDPATSSEYTGASATVIQIQLPETSRDKAAPSQKPPTLLFFDSSSGSFLGMQYTVEQLHIPQTSVTRTVKISGLEKSGNSFSEHFVVTSNRQPTFDVLITSGLLGQTLPDSLFEGTTK